MSEFLFFAYNRFMPNPIRTIIFDLDGVLLRCQPNTAEILTSVLPYPPETLRAQYFGSEFSALSVGRMFEDDFWATVSRKHGWNLPIEVPKRLIRQSFQEIEGTRQHVIDLRRRGYRLGILSNHVREWVDDLERRFQYHCLFDDALYSFQAGMMKPDRAVYAAALRRLHASAEETLFVDDRPENLLAARELGFRVLQFIGPEQFSRDIQTVLK